MVFASNHQSHMDVPVILAALPGRWRARVAPAMLKEFFKAHFFPAGLHAGGSGFTNTLNYYLAAFYFNAFPLPQREAGTRQTLQYIGELTGDGWSVLIFPEGVRADDRGHQAVSRRHRDDRVAAGRAGGPGPDRGGRSRAAPDAARWRGPGRVRVAFGAPMRLRGDDYAALAQQRRRRRVRVALNRSHPTIPTISCN